MQQAAALEALRQEVAMLRQPLPWPFPLPSPPLLLNHASHPQAPLPTLPPPQHQQQPGLHALSQQPQQVSPPSMHPLSTVQLHCEPCTGAAEPETPRLLLRPKGDHVTSVETAC
jgi:hypothetical protein